MLGAIIGDIAGQPYEFQEPLKERDFKLFTKDNCFTDDTVMTVAIADALLESGKDADLKTIRKNVTAKMKEWGLRYGHAGHGGMFFNWLCLTNAEPYNSYGNGSAMRVSAAGWLYDSLKRTIEVARATAEVTHNHPEGIKGAECTAGVIYLARTGATKDEIKEWVASEYEYDMTKSIDEIIAETNGFSATCQDSMPRALVAFLQAESYEETIRNAICLGWDTDTNAAIAGSMAEAYYGIPDDFIRKGTDYLTPEMKDVVTIFEKHKIPNGKNTNQKEDKNQYDNLIERYAALNEKYDKLLYLFKRETNRICKFQVYTLVICLVLTIILMYVFTH